MNDRPLTVELVLSLPETCPCFFFVFHGMTPPTLTRWPRPTRAATTRAGGGGEVYREALDYYLAAQA